MNDKLIQQEIFPKSDVKIEEKIQEKIEEPKPINNVPKEPIFNEEICSFCGGNGAVSRPGSGKPFEATECECCGLEGSPEKLRYLNYRDENRVTGVNADRLPYSIGEKIYYDKWREETLRTRGVNGGYGILQLLMSPTLSRRDPFSPFIFHGALKPEEVVTERDYKVAATVIQWLGTNIGRCFVDECRSEIEKYLKDEKVNKAIDTINCSELTKKDGKFCLSCHINTRFLSKEELEKLLYHYKTHGYPDAMISEPDQNKKVHLILRKD